MHGEGPAIVGCQFLGFKSLTRQQQVAFDPHLYRVDWTKIISAIGPVCSPRIKSSSF